MIDYLGFDIYNKETIEKVYQNKDLVKKTVKWIVPKEGSKAKSFHEFTFKNMKFFFVVNYEGHLIKLTIRGSMHYLKNDGCYNYDQFSFSEFVAVAKGFCKRFDINEYCCILLPIEYGVNLNLKELDQRLVGITAKELVTNVMCEKRKMFAYNPNHIKTSKRSGSPNHEYRLKAYSKTAEFPDALQDEEIIRLEVHQNKMRHLKDNGIVCLADLFLSKNQVFLMEKFLSYFNNLVLFDPSIVLPLESEHQEMVLRYSNPNFWMDKIDSCKAHPTTTKDYNTHVKQLNQLSTQYGCNLHANLMKILRNQYQLNIQ